MRILTVLKDWPFSAGIAPHILKISALDRDEYLGSGPTRFNPVRKGGSCSQSWCVEEKNLHLAIGFTLPEVP